MITRNNKNPYFRNHFKSVYYSIYITCSYKFIFKQITCNQENISFSFFAVQGIICCSNQHQARNNCNHQAVSHMGAVAGVGSFHLVVLFFGVGGGVLCLYQAVSCRFQLGNGICHFLSGGVRVV